MRAPRCAMGSSRWRAKGQAISPQQSARAGSRWAADRHRPDAVSGRQMGSVRVFVMADEVPDRHIGLGDRPNAVLHLDDLLVVKGFDLAVFDLFLGVEDAHQ